MRQLSNICLPWTDKVLVFFSRYVVTDRFASISLTFSKKLRKVAKCYRYEGFRGLYKGILPNLLRVVPSSSLTFLVYESVLKLLK